MPLDILMPALSPTMEKGTLVQWTKSVGDKVRTGDIVAEVETDKTAIDVVADADGVLSEIFVANGTTDVLVNFVIGRIALNGESNKLAATLQGNAVPATDTLSNRSAAAAEMPTVITNSQPGRIFASPIAKRLMAEAHIDSQSLTGTGPNGRIIERDVQAALSPSDSKPLLVSNGSRTPLAQRLESELESNTIRLEVDARRYFEPGSFDEVPHDALRMTIARRLSESKRDVPHFYLVADCAVGKLLKLRDELNLPRYQGEEPAYRLSINDFIIKAYALALHKVPDANVSFAQDAMLKHRHADIAVAVAIPGGLLTPIIRRAEEKAIAAIAAETRDLASRAKHRKLKPEEYNGGSASISNLGMYGVQEFTAIINPPQATILAVGAAARRVVANPDDSTSVDWIMRVTLSVDHRAVDGATAAQLLGLFKRLIENPIGLLVENPGSGRTYDDDRR